ncbi:MAG: hypothetical protein ABEJ85_04930 [Haloarculaceae archaeon]
MTGQEVEGEEEQREAGETSENENGEQPEIEADERADMGELADLAEQVEEEAGADVDDQAEETDDDASDGDGEQAEAAPATPGAGGAADWGDLYVGTVTTGLNAVIEEYGDEDADRIDESLARDLHLDEYVNEWMAEQGKAEMDPAQGMVVATAALCITVLVSRTDLPNKAVSKLQQTDA